MPATSTAAGVQFENKVRGSLKRVGFKDVDGGPKFTVGGYQVDAVGGWDDVLLVVEATQTTRKNASIRDEITAFRGKTGTLRRAFRESNAYSAYARFEFALVTQGYRFSENDKAVASDQQRIHLL